MPRSRENGGVVASKRSSDGSNSAKAYNNFRAVRTRSGSYDYRKNARAVEDRESAGRIRFNSSLSGGSSSRSSTTISTRSRYGAGGYSYKGRSYSYAREDYARSGFHLVDRYSDGRHHINRHYLFNYDGRFGHCPDRYTGRNYHFYVTLVSNNYYIGFGYNTWKRRYFGDGCDVQFGWNSGLYIPTAYQSYGAYYFEPNYAFSFTFNHGYEQGYIDGYARGVNDWNNYHPYNSWHTGVQGYNSWLGPYYEFSDGYEQGFRQGYYAGYSGHPFGYMNFGFGDFADYPVIYDFDYDYFDNVSYDGYEYNDGYEYDDGYNY